RLTKERDEAVREAHRWRHGTPIEGDYLCPDTLAMVEARAEVERMRAVRPFDEWHEDIGSVLWWRLPVCEPPWVGTPLDSDWPYLEHARLAWTELPVPIGTKE